MKQEERQDMIFRDIGNVELKGFDAEERTAEHVISTSTRDSMNDVVDAGGWEVERFMANPVVLADHRYSVGSIIGKTVELKSTRRALVAKTQFHDVGIGAAAFDLVASGMARAWSVGFRGLDGHRIADGAKKLKCAVCKREKNAILNGRDEDEVGYIHGRHYTKQELLEYSLVAIPANADAVMLQIQKGLLTEENAELLFRPDDEDHFGELAFKLDKALRAGEVQAGQIEALTDTVKELTEVLRGAKSITTVSMDTKEVEEDEPQDTPPAVEETPAPTKAKAEESEAEPTDDTKVKEKETTVVDTSARMSALAIFGAELRKELRGAEIKAALARQ